MGVWDLRQFVGINLDNKRPKLRSSGPDLLQELMANGTNKLKRTAEETKKVLSENTALKRENEKLKTNIFPLRTTFKKILEKQ